MGERDTWVLTDKKDNIGYLTLNRPEKLNAIPFVMLDDLVAALHRMENDEDVKVIVLRGNGRAFCAGHDLNYVGYVYGFQKGLTEDEKRYRPPQRNRLLFDQHLLENYRAFLFTLKPIIAQVQGYCIGAGAYLVQNADLAIVADDVMFGHPEQRLAFAGASFSLCQELMMFGYKKTRELHLLGEFYNGRECVEMGLANKSVPAEQLEAEVDRWARKVAIMPADALVMGKAATHLALEELGGSAQFQQAFVTHTMCTNLKFDKDEYNFFRGRRDVGTKQAFHERDARFNEDILH